MALSFCQMPRKVILHQYGQHHCPSLVPCETWTSLSARDCYLGLPQMFLPPSLSTHCLTHSEAKHVPREQLRRETSVLLGNAVILKKNLKIFLSGRAGWAAGLWGGSKKERKLQGIVHLLLLVPKSLPRLPQAAGPTTAEPRTTSCKFLCNAYCKSHLSESPLQSSSVLHIQQLLQNNVKNELFTSSSQMAQFFCIP